VRTKKYYRRNDTITFPGDFKDVFFVKLPLKTSQIRQPIDHISVDLQSENKKIHNMKKQKTRDMFVLYLTDIKSKLIIQTK